MSELLSKPIQLSEKEKFQRKLLFAQLANAARQELRLNGLNYEDGFQGLHPDELLTLSDKILSCGNMSEIYKLLAQKPATGKPLATYYDRLIGIQHRPAYAGLQAVMRAAQPQRAFGLDIGAGTGEVSLIIGERAAHTIVTDTVEPLLAVASRKLEAAGKPHTTLVMNAVDIDLTPNSIGIAAANGIDPYLTDKEYYNLLGRLHRVLVPGGTIYSYSDKYDDGKEPTLEYQTSMRARFVGSIVDAVLERSQQAREKTPFDFGRVSSMFEARFVRLPEDPREGIVTVLIKKPNT